MKRLNPAREPTAAWYRTTGYSGSERADVAVSTERSARGAVPFVWCHGFTLDADPARFAVQSPYREQLTAIAALGHPVLSADLGGGSTWGNTTAIARVDSLVTWAASAYGTRTDKVAIGGESMGSLLAFNWAWRNAHRVAALWVRAPLTALDAFHDRETGFAGAIETAYGGSGGYEAALATHDPALNRTALLTIGPRTRIEYTVDDELLPVSEVAAHVQATAPDEVHAWAGDHAGNQNTDPWAVAQWVHDTVRGIGG